MMAILFGQTKVSKWKTRFSVPVELPGARFPDEPDSFSGDDVKSDLK
jgi:hypothetical protein